MFQAISSFVRPAAAPTNQQRGEVKLEDLNLPNLQATARLSAVLPEEAQLTAEQALQKANPNVDFSDRAIEKHIKFLSRVDEQIARYKQQIAIWEAQKADHQALLPLYQAVKKIRREGEKRVRLSTSLQCAHSETPPSVPWSQTSSQSGRTLKRPRLQSDYGSDALSSDDESFYTLVTDSPRSGRTSEYAWSASGKENSPPLQYVGRPVHENARVRMGEASNPGPAFFPEVYLRGEAVLWLLPRGCSPTYNDRVLQFVRSLVESKDPKFKPSKQLHGTVQAGVYHAGRAFSYRNECFDESPIPPLFQELIGIGKSVTGMVFDTVLFKIYAPGESLAKHQDVDGSNMAVACFTFASDPSQLCKLSWHKGTASYTEKFAFTPPACSMWFMAGATNSQYSHRVHPAEHAKAGGLRVTVSLRQSANT